MFWVFAKFEPTEVDKKQKRNIANKCDPGKK